MFTEVLMLAASGALLLLLTIIQGTRNVFALGLPTAAGNQHDIAPWTGWNDRLNRATRNLIEAIAIFAPIVVAVVVLDASNSTTELGAKVFVGARIAHAVIFTAGIPYARTTAWFVGVVGIIMVGSQLIG